MVSEYPTQDFPRHSGRQAEVRKNSLFFGSHKMAKASAMYHTTISTCRMMGVSVMEYLKTFFRRIIESERDYSFLMPQTIGICVKNI